MHLYTLLAMAVGLAMDAFAVSITNGMCYRVPLRTGILMAFYFGSAQALMPVLGFLAGSLFAGPIKGIDHWAAFLILSLLGGKMIVEAVREGKNPEPCPAGGKLLANRMLLAQAVATSIDALAVGISLALMDVDIAAAASVIGAVTFLMCLLAVYIGKRFGDLLKGKAQIAGGIILIIIGLHIFMEHTMGA